MKRQPDHPRRSSTRLFYCPDAARAFRDDAAARETRVIAPLDVDLPPEESRHALHVLRLGAGERVRLLDGQGVFYEGVIAEVGRSRVSVRIDHSFPSDAEPLTPLILLVAQLKEKAAELLIQKSVELGVGELAFFPAARSVPRSKRERGETASPLSRALAPIHESPTLKSQPSNSEPGTSDFEPPKSRKRWDRIVISASKQCGRARLMSVGIHSCLDAALHAVPEDATRFVFWEGKAPKPRNLPGTPSARCESLRPQSAIPDPRSPTPDARSPVPRPICAVIGPEGGFTEEEIERVRRAGFLARSLGPRILRAETAALAAAAILLHEAGELGDP